MTTETARKPEWAMLRDSAELDYQVSLRTLEGMPVIVAMDYADQIYSDMHIADQVRRRAAHQLEEMYGDRSEG